jgi:hypothetical protein
MKEKITMQYPLDNTTDSNMIEGCVVSRRTHTNYDFMIKFCKNHDVVINGQSIDKEWVEARRKQLGRLYTSFKETINNNVGHDITDVKNILECHLEHADSWFGISKQLENKGEGN